MVLFVGAGQRLRLRRNNVQEFRESGTDVPVGTPASARSTEALRCFIEASAIHTLIRQRPPTPSCRGHGPYCGKNSEPGRRITESLTSNPRIREQPGSFAEIARCPRRCRFRHRAWNIPAERRAVPRRPCAGRLRRCRDNLITKLRCTGPR